MASLSTQGVFQRLAILAALAAALPVRAHAQLSLSTAVDLALRNSPQVHIAQAEGRESQGRVFPGRRRLHPVGFR